MNASSSTITVLDFPESASLELPTAGDDDYTSPYLVNQLDQMDSVIVNVRKSDD